MCESSASRESRGVKQGANLLPSGPTEPCRQKNKERADNHGSSGSSSSYPLRVRGESTRPGRTSPRARGAVIPAPAGKQRVVGFDTRLEEDQPIELGEEEVKRNKSLDPG